MWKVGTLCFRFNFGGIDLEEEEKEPDEISHICL